MSRIGCGTARNLALAYYRCRTRDGNLAGTCPNRVLGFRCRETRQGVATFFVGRVTCRRRGGTVRPVYEQFL